MEIIRKQFKFTPNKDYYLCLLLTSTVKDLGFFDTLEYNPYGYYGYGYGDHFGIGGELLFDEEFI